MVKKIKSYVYRVYYKQECNIGDESIGMIVVLAMNAEQALRAVKEERPRSVVTGVHLDDKRSMDFERMPQPETILIVEI